MSRFGILVGNGFTLDYSIPRELHSSYPLSTFRSSKISYKDFINKLPDVKKDLLQQKGSSHFNRISDYIDKNWSDANKNCQLRRFLALAYSTFQLTLDNHDINEWRWTDWLRENKENLVCAISFNYDLVLENAFRAADTSFYRVGTNEDIGNIPILKPHGSLDFDLPDKIISCPIEQRWNISTKLNDAQYVQTIPKSDWLIPRMEADIIPPSLHNIQLRLSWIQKMFNIYLEQVRQMDSFVIVGSSYWGVDRNEIDFFLKNLKKGSKVYIIDPNPNIDLIRKVHSLELLFSEPTKKGLPW
ncbi:hypothetical protein LIT25_21305 [Bacillus sp. F19]|nr:hypothetical protein LIT25_21305 [Bacillus sp. F19]